MKKISVAIVSLFFILCSTAWSVLSPGAKPPVKILFVGNSLTSTNDLPAMVRELGKLDGVEVQVTSIVNGDYSLDDHLEDGKVQQELKTGQYDFMVVQQGPSALPQSQELLLKSAAKYKELCKDIKTKLAFYTVWPSHARLFDLDNVITSYANAAKATGAVICPAGLAWKKAWAIDAYLPLYSPDEFHPSMQGSLLAALTIYGTLLEKDNFDFLPYDKLPWKTDVSQEHYKTIQQAAAETVKR